MTTSALKVYNSSQHHGDNGGDNDVADAVEEVVERQPWVETVTRLGWLAKGAVYALMGLTAYTIGRHRPTSDDASPEGALAQVVTNPGGLILLSVLAIGLILYSAWRVLTVLLISGHGPREWAERVGYSFSAAFYALLAFTAIAAVAHGDTPQDSNAIEDSRARCSTPGWDAGPCSPEDWWRWGSAATSSSRRGSGARSAKTSISMTRASSNGGRSSSPAHRLDRSRADHVRAGMVHRRRGVDRRSQRGAGLRPVVQGVGRYRRRSDRRDRRWHRARRVRRVLHPQRPPPRAGAVT